MGKSGGESLYPLVRSGALAADVLDKSDGPRELTSSSSSSAFLPLAFLLTTAFWALLLPAPAPVGCGTHVRHQQAA